MSIDRDPPEDITPPAPHPREFAGPGALVGLFVWVAVYALTLGLAIGLSQLGLFDVTSEASTWQVGGWLFYAAHLGPVALLGGPLPGSVVADVGGVLSVLAVVPAALVGLGGAVVVNRVGVPDPVEGLRGGAALALGYVGPSLAGALLLAGTIDVTSPGPATTYSLSPGPVGALVVGVAYPVVVGAVGGAIAGR